MLLLIGLGLAVAAYFLFAKYLPAGRKHPGLQRVTFIVVLVGFGLLIWRIVA
jgi:hypothetical protein